MEGKLNFLFLAGIVGGCPFQRYGGLGRDEYLRCASRYPGLGARFSAHFTGGLSILTTSATIRQDNEFTWFPIKEVAYLFVGIFVTMIPCLLILKAGSHGALAFIINGVTKPWHYFWMAGMLSSFLDNAPTYLTFFQYRAGQFFLRHE